jgi:hypothetical protein
MQINRELTPQERAQSLVAQAAAAISADAEVQAPQPEPQVSEAVVKPRPISLIDMAQANHANLMELGRMIQAQSQVLEAVAQAVGEIHAALYQSQFSNPEANSQQFDSEF